MIDALPNRDADLMSETLVETDRRGAQKLDEDHAQQTERQPRYHVILWDDDDHTYTYVVRMMKKLFGHSRETGLQIAESVSNDGRAVCLTTTLEHAELKRDQIHAFGKDDLIDLCAGSMTSTIEPEEI